MCIHLGIFLLKVSENAMEAVDQLKKEKKRKEKRKILAVLSFL